MRQIYKIDRIREIAIYLETTRLLQFSQGIQQYHPQINQLIRKTPSTLPQIQTLYLTINQDPLQILKARVKIRIIWISSVIHFLWPKIINLKDLIILWGTIQEEMLLVCTQDKAIRVVEEGEVYLLSLHVLRLLQEIRVEEKSQT